MPRLNVIAKEERLKQTVESLPMIVIYLYYMLSFYIIRI